MVFQVAAVNKILASIAGICDNGNSVLFRSDGGTITNLKDGREIKFRRQGNVYVMDMWVRNPRPSLTSGSRRNLPGTVAASSFTDKSPRT